MPCPYIWPLSPFFSFNYFNSSNSFNSYKENAPCPYKMTSTILSETEIVLGVVVADVFHHLCQAFHF